MTAAIPEPDEARRLVELRRELDLVSREFLVEQKTTILYGATMPREFIRPELLDLAFRTLVAVLGYDFDELAGYVSGHQNDTWIEAGDGGGDDLVLAYRGGGKSTIGTISRSIFYTVRNPDIRIGITSETEDLPKAFITEIKGHLENNAALIAMFGPFRPTRSGGPIWDAKRATINQRTANWKEPTFHAFGVGGQSAGYHYDVIFADDLVTFKGSRTRKVRMNLSDWYDSTFGGLQLKHTVVHHIGTPYFPGDLWDRLENGRKNEGVGPLKGSTLTIPAEQVDKTGQRFATSPGRLDLAALDRTKAKIGSIHYGTQYLMDRSKMVGSIFNLALFEYYDPADLDLDAFRSAWPRYCYFDLKATSKDSGDYFAGICIAVSPDKSRIDVVDGIRFRGGMKAQREAIVKFTGIHRPVISSVEAVAMQTAFAEEIQESTILPIRPEKVEGDKVMRAMRVLSLIESGKVHLPLEDTIVGRRLMDLTEELVQFPDSDHDDYVDALVGALTVAMFGGAPATGSIGDGAEDERGRRAGKGGKKLRAGARKLRARY